MARKKKIQSHIGLTFNVYENIFDLQYLHIMCTLYIIVCFIIIVTLYFAIGCFYAGNENSHFRPFYENSWTKTNANIQFGSSICHTFHHMIWFDFLFVLNTVYCFILLSAIFGHSFDYHREFSIAYTCIDIDMNFWCI